MHATLRQLCIGLLLVVASSCERATSQSERKPNDLEEVAALVRATKVHPSLLHSAQAGSPIRVDPYPHSVVAGHHMSHMSHMGTAR